MNEHEKQAVVTVALLAAFADGAKTDDERAEVRAVVDSLEGELPMAVLYRDVLMKKRTLETAVAQLSQPGTRQLAYEMAVGVVDSDGLRNEQETAFLEQLAAALSLSQSDTTAVLATADALAAMPLDSGGVPELATPAGAAGGAVAGGDARAVTDVERDQRIDAMILKASVLNGALELLPQSMASLAIIPLQMKLVHGIGKAHGHELDRGHVKELLAALGVGVTGQYLEDMGRKLVGGLLKRFGGRMAGNIGRGATGVAFSFATTWAIGQVARRYYAGGRTMSVESLRQSFAGLFEEAKTLQATHADAIATQARSIDAGKLVELVRGR